MGKIDLNLNTETKSNKTQQRANRVYRYEDVVNLLVILYSIKGVCRIVIICGVNNAVSNYRFNKVTATRQKDSKVLQI